MKKIIVLCIISLFLIQPVDAFASNHTMELNQYNSSKTNIDLIEPKKDITGWRYKNINGRLHKRLYNYSKESWIGLWIAC